MKKDYSKPISKSKPDDENLSLQEEVVKLNKSCMSEEFLSHGKDEIFELFVKIREEFDGSEYMQGKKDGLRTALALLGNSGLDEFNRGGQLARPPETEFDRLKAMFERQRIPIVVRTKKDPFSNTDYHYMFVKTGEMTKALIMFSKDNDFASICTTFTGEMEDLNS
jgi:hypothetical protein